MKITNLEIHTDKGKLFARAVIGSKVYELESDELPVVNEEALHDLIHSLASLVEEESKFQAGDEVVVTNHRGIFANYLEWAEAHLTKEQCCRFQWDHQLEDYGFDHMYKVVCVHPHGHGDGILAAIEDVINRKIYIANTDKLEKVKF